MGGRLSSQSRSGEVRKEMSSKVAEEGVPTKKAKATPLEEGQGDCFSDDDDRSAFGNIRIGAEFYDEELRYVKHNDPETTYLNLNHMDEFTNRAWARVGSIVKNNTYVRRVNLSGCDLESGFTALMEGGLMDRNAPLTGLSLTQNTHIFHYGNDKLLGKYLEKNKDMEDLDLEETDVTPDTLRNILPGLDGSKLQDLNISHGMLQDDSVNKAVAAQSGSVGTITPTWDGVLKIFEDINLPELTCLVLSHCQGGADLCQAVAHLLKNKSNKLRSVDLSSNMFGDYLDGYGGCDCEVLKSAVKENTTLKHLDLSYNEEIDDWVEKWIVELKESNSPLRITYNM